MILVDKDQKNKSIFSIGDFRHNIAFGDEAQKHSSQVMQVPKSMFGWNDNKRYNQRLKKDSTVIPFDKKMYFQKKNLIKDKWNITEELKQT